MHWRRPPSSTDTGSKRTRRSARPTQLALEQARDGDPGRLWIVSKRQESGRGRRGRNWETPHGNLAATLLLVGRGELKLAATLGFVAGLALSDALAAIVPAGRIGIGVDGGQAAPGRSRFELKWPNDVLADGAKLAGILLESAQLDGGRYALAIGIGVNVVAHPEGLPYPATSLAALGADVDAEALFLALSDAWTVERARLGRGPRPGAHPQQLAGARRRAGRRTSRCASTAMSCAACSRRSTTTAAS